jgi:hypothetical protein
MYNRRKLHMEDIVQLYGWDILYMKCPDWRKTTVLASQVEISHRGAIVIYGITFLAAIEL